MMHGPMNIKFTVLFIFGFLTSRNSQISMSFSYRIAHSAVHFITIPTCEAIWNKHFEIQTPHNSGSLFFKYRKTFSVVLLALADVNYKFILIDVEGYGKSSDGGLSTRSILENSLEGNMLNISNSKPPPNSEEPLPL